MTRLIQTLVGGVLLLAPAWQQDETAVDWSGKAQELYRAGKFAASADAYEEAIEAGARRASIYYNAACSSARAGRPKAALRWLEEAITSGWRDVGHLQGDADLKSLHPHARWPELVEKCRAARDAYLKTLKHPELHLELMEMKRVDQQIRVIGHAAPAEEPEGSTEPAGHQHQNEHQHKHGHEEDPGQQGHDHEHEHEHDESHSPHGPEMHSVDARNTARMKEIVAQYGWPTRSMVGAEGATAAWLLVQHADSDPGFQRHCLELMKAAPAGEVSTVDLAYLTDRVLVNEGKEQLFGTQFWFHQGRMAPRPIEDRANLDQRRKAAGLGSFAEYERHMTGPHDH